MKPITHNALNRVRDTVATRRFNDNVQRLVQALRTGQKSMFELMDILNVSPSAIRKYLRSVGNDMLRESAPAKHGPGSHDCKHYWIEAADADVDAFIASLGSNSATPPDTDAAPELPRKYVIRDCDRRVKCGPAKQLGMQRDPLVAALFGGAAP